jgi:NADH:ubiquinone oxidoreductase subunit C
MEKSHLYTALKELVKLFKDMKSYRQNSEEDLSDFFKANKVEKIIIAKYSKIFTLLFDILGTEYYQYNPENKKSFFKVFHNMIYIFKGEPTQLQQMH